MKVGLAESVDGSQEQKLRFPEMMEFCLQTVPGEFCLSLQAAGLT